jgi:hypothetical protein
MNYLRLHRLVHNAMFTRHHAAMHSPSPGLQSKMSALAPILMLVNTWLLLRGYHGLVGDAKIYAFQALARIHPQLAGDLYLQNTSQDQFTIFSPIYAQFIEIFGLEHAARLLTLIFTIWFLAAAWSAVRVLTDRTSAWLAIASLLVVSGGYGGSGVFQYFELFLTARLPAEALIVTALACYIRGWKKLAFAIATATMLVHPLIALPGLLLLICLSAPIRFGIAGAIVSPMTALAIVSIALGNSRISHALPIMDPDWLKIVQERSQFLFLQLWSFRDWGVNARPFFYLAFTGLALQDARVRNLAICAALVASAGLAVAFIASTLGPVAIFVQGQAWRWVWIAAFVAILLLPESISRAWQDPQCGPLCAILLICGWILPAVDGIPCVSLAITLWVMREHIGPRSSKVLRWLAFAALSTILVWVLVESWPIVASNGKTNALIAPNAPPIIAKIFEISQLKFAAVIGFALVGWALRTVRSTWTATTISAALLVSLIFFLPSGFTQSRVFGAVASVAEFSDWQAVIPRDRTVLTVPSRDVGSFVWFTLQRPNYLTVDQSAGVIFSRATALEIKRRSEILLPVTEPDWKIMNRLRESAVTKGTAEVVQRPLTADSLAQICEDPKLGFVVAQSNVGFHPLSHQHSGPWKDWNLYDCRQVNQIK